MIIPVGFAQANLKFGGVLLPTGAEVTIGFDVQSYAGTPSDAALDIGGSFINNCMGNLSDQLVLTSVLVKFGPNATGASAEEGMAANAGGDTGPAASPNVTYLIHKSTLAGGHAGKGRMYLPGVVEGAISSAGVVDTAKRGALTSDFSDWAVALGVADLTPVLLHAAGSPISSPTPITGFETDLLVATQRRRQRR